MEDDLVARLKGDTTIAALVSEAVSWGGLNREDLVPAIVLQMVSPGRDYDHDGPTGEDEPRIQIDCYAPTDAQAAALKRAVQDCMEQPATVGSTKFEEGFLDTESWIDEGEQDGGEPLFRVSQDYIFLHSAA